MTFHQRNHQAMTDIKAKFEAAGYGKFTQKNVQAVLRKAADAYYNSERRIMTDESFDQYVKEYTDTFGVAFEVGAPIKVGNTLELSHSYTEFAGTLHKSQTFDDFHKWLKAKKIASKEFVVSLKADGHSITVEYEMQDGALTVAKVLTRGQDGVGKDLTALFSDTNVIPIPAVTRDCAVGFEAVIEFNVFEALVEQDLISYKSPRSAMSGILSNSGRHLVEFVTLLPLRIKFKEGAQLARDKAIRVLDLMSQKSRVGFQKLSIQQLEKYYTDLHTTRFEGKIPFMVDGIVVECADEKERERLGYSGNEPNFITALKLSPAEKETKVRSVSWSAQGHSATFTPVIHFDPVVINGITYKQVSVANYRRFNELRLRVQSPIQFSLRNDVLGYIDTLHTVTPLKTPLLEAIKNCPYCNCRLVTDDTRLFCSNSQCELNLIAKYYAFVEKTGIKNVGRETIAALVRAKLLKGRLTELLDLDTKQVAAIEGLGAVSASNLAKEVAKIFDPTGKNPFYDWQLLAGLNIRLIGRRVSKKICLAVDIEEIFESVYKILDAFDDVILIDRAMEEAHHNKTYKKLQENVGEAITYELYLSLITELDEVEAFLERATPGKFTCEHILSSKNVTGAAPDKVLTFVHTGSASPLKKRDELEALIASKGHTLSGAVSKNTSYLINNDTQSTSGKNARAKELNIPIISVQQLIELLQ